MRRLMLLAVLLAVVAGACTPTSVAPSAEPSPSGPVKVKITDATKGELQSVLQKRVDALVRKDLNAYQATYDGTRTALRRCQEEDFQVASRQGLASTTAQVLKVEPYLDTYVRAWVSDGSAAVRRYFRREGERWLLTEPRADELGGEKKKVLDGLELSYWGIDDDVIDILGKGSLATRDFLKANQRGETRAPFAMRFFPTRETAGVIGCRVIGTHFINDPKDPYLRIYRVAFDTSLTDLDDFTKGVFKHEGLHWLQDQFIPGISARLDWWLTEGWPDYLGQVDRVATVRRVVCGGSVPTFKQLVDGPPQELDTPPEVPGQYYAFANTMIEYMYATFGKDAYWDMMTTYKDGVDPKVNYPKVLKVTPEQYYAAWLAFTKKKYC